MSLILWLPTNKFKLGDSADVRINGESARVTWSDIHTLTIEPDDRRRILKRDEGPDGLTQFLCSDDERDMTVTERGGFLTIDKPRTNPPFNPTLKNPKVRG
jgi:hypothetical protein